METMTLVHTSTKSTDLTGLPDTEIETWFSQAGLAVEVVPHCDNAACEACFEASTRQEQAA